MKKIFLVLSIILIIFSSVYFIFGPYKIRSCIWHFMNNEKVEYNNIKILVPNNWWIYEKIEERLILFRVPISSDNDNFGFSVRNINVMNMNENDIVKKVENFCNIKNMAEVKIGEEKSLEFLCEDVVKDKNIPRYFFVWVTKSKNTIINSTEFDDMSAVVAKKHYFEALDYVSWDR